MTERIDWTMVPTEQLPPGLAHVEFPADRIGEFQAARRAGALTVCGSVVQCGGTVYATVKRTDYAPQHQRQEMPAWVRPVAIGAALAGLFVGILVGVAHLIRTATSAMSDTAPAVGFVLALAVVLFVAVAVDRRRKGRTVTVTTVTQVRVK